MQRSDSRIPVEEKVLDYLSTADQIAPHAQGRRYRSAWGLLLDCGVWCRPEPFPARLKRWRGLERACFANTAALVAAVPGLVYVEGFAAPAGIDLVVEHAWALDPATGAVLDPTWIDSVGDAYLGIPLTAAYRRQVLQARPARLDTIQILDTYANPDLLAHGLPAEATAFTEPAL